ncbi:C10 family peptidase, partial [Bacteroidota bacterium]
MKEKWTFCRKLIFRISSVLLLLFLFAGQIMADEVNKEKAKKIAENFFQQTLSLNNLPPLGEELKLFSENKSLGLPDIKNNYYYIFNAGETRGFVIVSAEDQVEPILGYSLEGSYSGENPPPAFVKWMEEYKKQIEYIRTYNISATKETQEKWEQLDSYTYKYSGSLKSVAPLLVLNWDQSPYYNEMCPYDYTYGSRTVTGCVATAMAMIMKYHNHPAQGEGHSSYNHNRYGTLSANYGATTYEWSQMPNEVTSSNDAVALLMYHCGVSVEMDYGTSQTGGSSTSSLDVVANALKQYFSYDNSTSFVIRANYTDEIWKQLLRTDLDNNRPIEYAGTGNGSGHAFVCDGYQQSDYFHFNWGWSGSYNNYFYIDNLVPSGTSTSGGGGNYSYNQLAVIGIQPKGEGGGGEVTDNQLGLHSEIVVNPNPMQQGQEVDVNVSIANYGTENFIGDYSAMLFNSDNEFISIIESKSGTLEANYFYDLVFHNDVISLYPG